MIRVDYMKSCKPWSTGDKPQVKGKAAKIQSQEEIDICLQCTAVSCNHGDCSQFRAQRAKQEGKKPPADFAEYSARQGMTIAKVAFHYGVTPSTVSRWRKMTGIARRPALYTKVDLDEFAREAKSGRTLRWMKEHFHMGNDRAKEIYRQLGIPIPTNVPKKRPPTSGGTHGQSDCQREGR